MVVVEVVDMDEWMDEVDVVVIGGGAAGLSGALMLARARRSVVVIDAGAPRNAPAQAVHGLLARDGTPPAELRAQGREEVRRYGGRLVDGQVTAAVRTGAGFTVTLADGRSVTARRLLVTSGLVDELPDVAGLRDRWGRDVLHCPYCHGWEVRDQAVGVLASGPMSVHQALLFRQLTADVTFFSHTLPPTPEQAEQLAARGIAVVDGEVAAVEVTDDRLTGVRLRDGRMVRREAVVVATRMVARAGFLDGLGLRAMRAPERGRRVHPRRPDRPDRGARGVGRRQRHGPDRAGRSGRGGRGDGSGPHQRRPRHGGDAGGGRRAAGTVGRGRVKGPRERDVGHVEDGAARGADRRGARAGRPRHRRGGRARPVAARRRTDRLDPAGRLVALPPGQGPRPRAPGRHRSPGGTGAPSSRAVR